MKITVFGDVHGNLPALELFLKRETPDKYIFLGDAVNYGPWGNECVEIISELENCICIKGNHEEDFIKGVYSGENSIASKFFNFCYPKFKKFETIKKYINSYSFDKYRFLHTLQNRNIYIDTEIELDGNYFIGHSHHQLSKKNKGFELHNPGSIGQNRAFINVISYLNWYPETNQVDFCNFTYNHELVISEMKKQSYPEACINYYLQKPKA